jgi:hypothetical protein
MSEIEFNVWREGSTVNIDVRPFKNVKYVLRFKKDAGDENAAEAFYRLIRDGMHERVLAIRQDAYDLGYKHGRAKQARQKRVFGCINTEVEP